MRSFEVDLDAAQHSHPRNRPREEVGDRLSSSREILVQINARLRIDVHNSFGSRVALQIPMHDAALYLVDASISTNSIIKTFEEAVKKWIPNSNPVV